MTATPEQAMAVIEERYGRHAGHRALHAKGTFCEATFTATPEASDLCRAPHMSGTPVPALVRFSNGGGDPKVPDYAPDVRGLSVSFELPDGERTDILCQTIEHFPFKGVDGFLRLVALGRPSLRMLPGLAALIAREPKVALHLPSAIRNTSSPPASFAARRYFAFHAYRWIDADGGERWVRYTWHPTIDESDLSTDEARSRGRDYLFDDLRGRLADGPLKMKLEVQIAAPADDPHHANSEWPADRTRVTVGTLEVTGFSDQDDRFVMDPMRVCDGIEPSDDAVLHFRPRVYSDSYERRAEG